MKRSPARTARRIVVRSIVLSLLAMMTGLMAVAIPMLQYRAADTRAIAEADGVISDTGVGGERDVAEVTWSDQWGAPHVTWFEFAHPEEWPVGEAFRIRYDPASPFGEAFAAPEFDEYVLTRFDDLVNGLACFLLVAIILLAAWLARGLLTRSASAASVSSWQAIPMIGVSNGAALPVVVLVPVETPVRFDPLRDPVMSVPDGAFLQRVYRDPALDRIVQGEIVTARIGSGIARRAILDLVDGTRIWPAGRLRRRPYWGWRLAVRVRAAKRPYEELRSRASSGDPEAARMFEEIVRAELTLSADHQIDPADAHYQPVAGSPIRLWPNAKATLVLAGSGAVIGLLVGGPPFGLLGGAGLFLTLGAFSWGWRGGEPELS